MGLIPSPPCSIESGQILFRAGAKAINLAKLDPRGRAIRSIRGNQIAMIFQEPMTSLNPVFTVGMQIIESITLHQHLSRKEAREKAIDMLRAVGISSPEQRIKDYPNQLSGGMRQRVMIAMALSCHPSLLVADEPTTALDVTIQAQVLDLMNDLRAKFHMAIMFITHDLGVIAQMADRVAVMYLGKIVEAAPVTELFDHPGHPYTRGLMKSIPSLTMTKKNRLIPINGVVPELSEVQDGCGFEPRCPNAMKICKEQVPPLKEVAPEHTVACWLNGPS
jgi:oligopeptide/dipeptide ABC transporter ATP-binding protein